MNPDLTLALVLLFVLPARALWRSFKAKRTRMASYVQTTAIIIACLAVLATQWVWSDRKADALGLLWPLGPASWASLALAALVIGVLGFAMRWRPLPAPEEDGPLPQTVSERRAFFFFAIIAGAGWELLYRGFLLWYLEPRIGLALSIILAAVAYGLAHGVRDRQKTIGSLISAFIFTIAYVLTRELWWLMLLHIGLPMLAVLGRSAGQKGTCLEDPGAGFETDLFRIAEKVQEFPMESLSPKQQWFRAIWEFEAEVNNGGFDQYFFNSAGRDAPLAREALKQIGAYKCSILVDRALAAVGYLEFDWSNNQRRRERMVALGDAVSDELDALDSEFWQYPDDLGILLAAFVRANPDEFGS